MQRRNLLGNKVMTSSSPPLSGPRTAERRAFKRKGNAQERSPKPDRSPVQLFGFSISMKGTLLHGFCNTRKLVGVDTNAVLFAPSGDYHHLPNRVNEASGSAGVPSCCCGERQGYTSASIASERTKGATTGFARSTPITGTTSRTPSHVPWRGGQFRSHHRASSPVWSPSHPSSWWSSHSSGCVWIRSPGLLSSIASSSSCG